MYFMDNLDSIDYPPPPFTAQFVDQGSDGFVGMNNMIAVK